MASPSTEREQGCPPRATPTATQSIKLTPHNLMGKHVAYTLCGRGHGVSPKCTLIINRKNNNFIAVEWGWRAPAPRHLHTVHGLVTLISILLSLLFLLLFLLLWLLRCAPALAPAPIPIPIPGLELFPYCPPLLYWPAILYGNEIYYSYCSWAPPTISQPHHTHHPHVRLRLDCDCNFGRAQTLTNSHGAQNSPDYNSYIGNAHANVRIYISIRALLISESRVIFDSFHCWFAASNESAK